MVRTLHASIRRLRPVCFIHIEKTGGTSLIEALSGDFDHAYLGDLSLQRLKAIGDRSGTRVLFAGHCERDAASLLSNDTLKFTIVRNPRDQAVSKFFGLCRRGEANLSSDEPGISFIRHVRSNPYILVHQTRSLLGPFCAAPLEVRDVVSNLEAAVRLARQLDFIGCLERQEDLAFLLPMTLGVRMPLALPCSNRAVDHGTDDEAIAACRKAYDGLRDDRELAGLIRTEHHLYNEVLRIVEARSNTLEVLERAIRLSALNKNWARDYAAYDTQLRTIVGVKADGVLRLNGTAGCGLYGPYVDVPTGRCVAKVRVQGERRGRIKMEICASVGAKTLASQDFDLDTNTADFLELATELACPAPQVEVRLFCESGATLDVVSVHLRSIQAPPCAVRERDIRVANDSAPEVDEVAVTRPALRVV